MQFRHLFLLLTAIILTQAGCGAEPDLDGKHDELAPPGKADDIWGECHVQKVLAWVNSPETTLEVLQAAGVHTRAARNIVNHRNGPDAVAGTEDDEIIDSIEELDAIYYVGPKAMEQLVMAVDHLCRAVPVAEVVFSPQPWAESHLARMVELIDAAQVSVDVAMYSFREASIRDALERAVNRGVSVRFVFESANADRSDPAGTMSARLEELGINVRYVNKIMHHKFAIIDGPRSSMDEAVTGILATGSGNWSNSAGTVYDENTLIVSGQDELLLRFQQEFNLMWENSRDFVWTEDLPYDFSLEINDGMIPDGPALDVGFTSANFTIRNTSYGPTFYKVSGSNAVADKLVELIQGANQSIHIASGHLRSRPVAEALLARWAENPGMDIRVYLDGQEYISESTYADKVRELDDCLEEAGDSVSKQQTCLDKGFYYSYPLHEAGIPLRFKYYAYRWDYHYAVQMHHKYLVVDGRVLATGSYNLSDNAEHNTLENMIFIDRALFPSLVDAFEANFEIIWETGRAGNLYDDLVNLILETDDPFPVVFESMALGWEEVNYLKRLMWENCPDINTQEWRDNPNAHRTCYR